jgi:hypothetical protein
MCRTTRIAACSSPSAMSSRLAIRDDCSILHAYHISIGYRYRCDDGRLLATVHTSRPGDPLAAQTWSAALTRRRCPAGPAAVSIGRYLLLCCNTYCNTFHRSDRCSAWHFGMRQSRTVTEFWLTTWSGVRLGSSVYYIGIRCTELRTEDGRDLPAGGRSGLKIGFSYPTPWR